jgi:hypothetical protein
MFPRTLEFGFDLIDMALLPQFHETLRFSASVCRILPQLVATWVWRKMMFATMPKKPNCSQFFRIEEQDSLSMCWDQSKPLKPLPLLRQ